MDRESTRLLGIAAGINESKSRGESPTVRDGGFVSLLTPLACHVALLDSIVDCYGADPAIATKAAPVRTKLLSCIREWQAILNDPDVTPDGPTKTET